MRKTDLRRQLDSALSFPGSGVPFEDFQPATALDEFFIKQKIIYELEPNQFFRAQIAELLLKELLFRQSPSRFRDENSINTGQGDIEFLTSDGNWEAVSIKCKGRDNRGTLNPKAPTGKNTLSALNWQQTATTYEAECPMLLIWDAHPASEGQLRRLERGTGASYNHGRGLCIVGRTEFNRGLRRFGTVGATQNKTPTAFRLEVVQNALKNENNWVRPRTGNFSSTRMREVIIPQRIWGEYGWNITFNRLSQ